MSVRELTTYPAAGRLELLLLVLQSLHLSHHTQGQTAGTRVTCYVRPICQTLRRRAVRTTDQLENLVLERVGHLPVFPRLRRQRRHL
jgi:hypothetical protein